MDNKNNTKKKVIITILAFILVAVAILFALKGCQKEEPVIHNHSYSINEEGTWTCNEDGDILSNTDKPYVAILDNNQPKEIIAVDALSKSKTNFGNGTIYKDDNTIYYKGNNPQTIIIKTQKVDDKQEVKDKVVINAPKDTVYHYGSSTVISLDAVATNSFHEYGKVDLITLTKARVVLENPSDVREIYLDINNTNYSYETTIIALKEKVELPRLTRDAVDLEEGEVKTLAIVQKLKDEVKTETNEETNEVIETVLEVQAADDDYVKIENVRKSNDELIIEAFLSPNADENDKTQTETQTTSTITLEEAKEGSSHPASHNTFVSKQEKVVETVKPVETKVEETKQEEVKPVVKPTVTPKKEETKPEEDKPNPKPSHIHSYGDWYDLDDTYHAKKCSCGDTVKEAHVLDTNGVCQKCGHNAVAKIGNVYYKTLKTAVEAATDNSTIVILENITVDNSNVIDKNITLELNGKKIVAGNTWNGASPTAQGIFYVKSGAKFTINDSIETGEISTENSNVYGAIVLTIGGDASNNDSSKTAELVVNGGTLKGYYYGVVTNGNRHNTKITVNGGTLTGVDLDDATSIYHPSEGALIINGGTLKGYDGIAIKGGTPVTINGGTFIATGTKVVPKKAASSGCNSVGSALYVEGNYGYGANVVVNGGTFKVTDSTAPAVLSLFNEEEVATIQLKGGVYDSDPSEYVATGYVATKNKPETDKYTVEFGFAGGNGTKDDPLLISTEEEFLNLDETIINAPSDVYFKLTNDMNMGKETIKNQKQYVWDRYEWFGLFYDDEVIHLDLNNKRIYNLDCFLFAGIQSIDVHDGTISFVNDANSNSKDSCPGLIYYIACGTEDGIDYHRKLTFKNLNLEGQYEVNMLHYGPLVSQSYGGSFDTDIVSLDKICSNVVINNVAGGAYSGGMLGYVYGPLTVKNSTFNGLIQSPLAGGFINPMNVGNVVNENNTFNGKLLATNTVQKFGHGSNVVEIEGPESSAIIVTKSDNLICETNMGEEIRINHTDNKISRYAISIMVWTNEATCTTIFNTDISNLTEEVVSTGLYKNYFENVYQDDPTQTTQNSGWYDGRVWRNGDTYKVYCSSTTQVKTSSNATIYVYGYDANRDLKTYQTIAYSPAKPN